MADVSDRDGRTGRGTAEGHVGREGCGAGGKGRLVVSIVNMFLLIATVAAVGRTTAPFVIAILLAIPAVWFQYHGLWMDDDWELAESWMFSGASNL